MFPEIQVGSVPLAVAAMSTFIMFFSMSWASGFWVLVSEMFSMRYKPAAASAATAVLFASGAFTDLLFLSLVNALHSRAFYVFAFMAALSSVYVYLKVPETKVSTFLL
jgi:hypothetical protein